MKDVIYQCPECDNVQIERGVREKTTAVCEACRWPVDLYPDGRVATCALTQCAGTVEYIDHHRWCWGQHHGVRTMRTR